VVNFFKLDHDMILFSQIDKGKAFAETDRLMINTILFAVMVAGFATMAGVLYSKTLTQPLSQLMVATENLAAGNYKLADMDIKTNDEVRALPLV
jgi:nitrogen fixation/metabolism regulation signal transduction histidine kinase